MTFFTETIPNWFAEHWIVYGLLRIMIFLIFLFVAFALLKFLLQCILALIGYIICGIYSIYEFLCSLLEDELSFPWIMIPIIAIGYLFFKNLIYLPIQIPSDYTTEWYFGFSKCQYVGVAIWGILLTVYFCYYRILAFPIILFKLIRAPLDIIFLPFILLHAFFFGNESSYSPPSSSSNTRVPTYVPPRSSSSSTSTSSTNSPNTYDPYSDYTPTSTPSDPFAGMYLGDPPEESPTEVEIRTCEDGYSPFDPGREWTRIDD